MKKAGRTLAATATTIGLALVVTGCGDNVIGADGPQPGIAAQVEDTEISLDDLSSVVDGLCVLQAADPNAAPTSRAYAQTEILELWVRSLVDAEFADDQGIDAERQDPALELAPGWDDVHEDDRDSLQEYVDAVLYASAVQEAAGEDEMPDPADYDITINPRFDAELEDGSFVPADDQLAVPVGDDAAVDTEAPTPEMLEDLPDDELCGKRQEAQPTQQIPVG